MSRFIFPSNPATTPGPVNQKIITVPLHERSDGSFVNASREDPTPVRAFGAISLFGEVLTSKRRALFELKSSYGLSDIRDLVAEENGASIDDINSGVTTGEIRLRTGTDPNARADLEVAEIGRYQPGSAAEIGVGVRIDPPLTTSQEVRVGGRTPSGTEGLYFLFDTVEDISVVRLRNGTENAVPRSQWNVDALDGTGPSGFDLDMTKGAILQVDFAWYGYGQIVYGVIGTPDGQLVQEFIPCHIINNQDITGTSIQSPNLRVFCESINNGSTSSFDTFIGGRQYSVIGDFFPMERTTGDYRYEAPVSTSLVPLLTFQRKTGFEDRSIKVAGFEIETDNDIAMYILTGTVLTSPSYVTPRRYTAAETALEVDRQATAITTQGEVLYPDIFFGTKRSGAQNVNLDFDVPEGDTVCIAAVRAGNTDATVSAVMRLIEEW